MPIDAAWHSICAIPFLSARRLPGWQGLSDEYRALLKRNESADRLLKDAWSRNRDATDIAERLQQAGYKLFEGTWMTDTEYVARFEGQMEQAIRAGRVDTGMTPPARSAAAWANHSAWRAQPPQARSTKSGRTINRPHRSWLCASSATDGSRS